jgi:regulator of sigma E protease
MEIISNFFWFLVVTCVLVAWHEFGHFWVGRKCGVKVLRYAIGFGPALWKRTGKDDIEYAINAIPLGGYVKFADTRDGSVAPEDEHRAFDKQSLSKRSAIVLAGPLANLLFAFVAFAAMYMVGVADDRAVLGKPSGISEHAGLLRGDEIVRIGSADIGNWTQATIELMQAGYEHRRVEVLVRSALTPNAAVRSISLDLTALPAKFDERGIFSVLGMEPYFRDPDTLISQLPAGNPAALAGLVVGERVVALNGTPMQRSKDFIEAVQKVGKANAGKMMLTLERNGVSRDVPVTAQYTVIEGISAWRLGIRFEGFETVRQLGPIDAFVAGVSTTGYYCTRTFGMIKSLLLGQASTKNISGPITIAQLAGASAEQGPGEFLRLLAGISLSLFIVNLLPVPILDGGQLLFFAMEKIKGAPLGERAMEAGGIIGILVLFGLMTLAFTNDITRTFGL